MEKTKLIQPESCVVGGQYYINVGKCDGGKQFLRIIFISYRPHPAEVVIDDGSGPRVVKRLDLFQNGDLGFGKVGNSRIEESCSGQ